MPVVPAVVSLPDDVPVVVLVPEVPDAVVPAPEDDPAVPVVVLVVADVPEAEPEFAAAVSVVVEVEVVAAVVLVSLAAAAEGFSAVSVCFEEAAAVFAVDEVSDALFDDAMMGSVLVPTPSPAVARLITPAEMATAARPETSATAMTPTVAFFFVLAAARLRDAFALIAELSRRRGVAAWPPRAVSCCIRGR